MRAPEIEGLTELRELGRGGFGVVYRAHQPAFGRDVAVKVIPGGSVDAEAISRFERECRATGAVSGHPNIVRVHDAGVTADGDPYLVMDLLPNGTLAERVRRDGPLDAGATVGLGIALAGALETAHRGGIVHRDVKPENVLFSAFGEAQLVDFGIARMQNAYETRSGSVSATLAHAAPELIAGAEATPQSDLYSLGSLLFFGMTGETAFGRPGEQSLAPLINRITSEPVPDLSTRGIPAALAAVIEKAMAKAPADRYPSAAAMGEALRGAAGSLGIPASPVPIAAPVSGALFPAGVAAGELTNQTLMRRREGAPAMAPAPVPVTAGGRRRPLILGSVALAALLVLGLVVVKARGGEAKAGDQDASATSTSTESSSTTVTSTDPTTVPPDTAATTVATSGPLKTTVTTKRPAATTTRPAATTAPTSPPTTIAVPTTVAVRVPGPVVDAASANPVAVDEINGVPQHVRVTLSWRAPSDNGGSGPTRYRILCTLMMGSSPYTGSVGPAPCKGGYEFPSTPGGVTSFQPVVERVEPGPGTWLKWEIVAVNEAGSGPVTAAQVVVPNFVGLMSWQAYPYGRAVGIALAGGQRGCGAETSTICEQSRPAGAVVAGGAAVIGYEQP